MYSSKSLRSRIKAWGIPEFIRYSVDIFQSWAPQIHLLLRKDKTRSSTRPAVYKTWVCEADEHAKLGWHAKALDISSATILGKT